MAVERCTTKEIKCGAITDLEQLKANLGFNCIPFSVMEMEEDRYEEFLDERRKLMAKKIKNYYMSL